MHTKLAHPTNRSVFSQIREIILHSFREMRHLCGLRKDITGLPILLLPILVSTGILKISPTTFLSPVLSSFKVPDSTASFSTTEQNTVMCVLFFTFFVASPSTSGLLEARGQIMLGAMQTERLKAFIWLSWALPCMQCSTPIT